MAMTHQRADASLDDALRGTATPHVWVHTGDPGATGTANVAQVSAAAIARKAASFAAPENHPDNVERRVLSDAVVEWTGAQIDAAQDLTHFSIWSAEEAGAPEFVAPLTGAPTTGSDGVRFPVGDLEVAIGVHVRPE